MISIVCVVSASLAGLSYGYAYIERKQILESIISLLNFLNVKIANKSCDFITSLQEYQGNEIGKNICNEIIKSIENKDLNPIMTAIDKLNLYSLAKEDLDILRNIKIGSLTYIEQKTLLENAINQLSVNLDASIKLLSKGKVYIATGILVGVMFFIILI